MKAKFSIKQNPIKAKYSMPSNGLSASFSIGGGGVSNDYSLLFNKPLINGIELIGDKTSLELGLASLEQGLLAQTALQPNDNISELVNNVGYITGITSSDIQTALGYIPYSSENPSGFITISALSGYATENWVGQQGYLTNSDLTDYVQFTDLATVATTGDYDDLIDKPIPPVGYGTSSTAAATATKVVSIPEITELNVGQVIIIKPSTTSTVANSKIKLNDFEAYNMRYNNANITTSTDSIVWTANVASMFIFDGTYWQFLGHGLDNNTNTTYASMSVDEGITGTATANRSLTAAHLKQIIQGTKLKGLVTTDDADVVASDSITIGIGKLQAQSTETKSILSDKQDLLVSGTNIKTINNQSLLGSGNIDIQGGGSTPTNMVTTDTAQDISGKKTFLGEKAIYFKQQTTSNKLGFTLYDPNNVELGALEYRPNTIGSASLLALNCPQTTGGYVGFRYWGTPAVNIVAPKVATAGNYYMTTHITNGSTTVTANNAGLINISTLIPTIATSVNSGSTNAQTVGAKLFYDTVGNIETLLSYV